MEIRCNACGSILEPGTTVCPSCGTPVTVAPQPGPVYTATPQPESVYTTVPQSETIYTSAPQPAKQSNVFGIIGLIFSILGLLIWCCGGFWGLIFTIPAIVLSILSLVKLGKNGLGITGIIISGITILLFILRIILLAILGAAGITSYEDLMNSYYLISLLIH